MAVTWSSAGWSASTAYILGARVINGVSVYVARAAGTSAASGGPTGTSTGIVDGGVTWDYVGAASVFSVVAIAPELATASAATQAFALAATDGLDAEFFGDRRDEAAAYLAAHVATVARSGGAGQRTAESVGPLSESYATLGDYGPLGQSSYGVQFERLVRLTPAIFGFTA